MAKSILIVSTRVPYPDTAGFKKRLLAFSRILHDAGHHIELFTLTNDMQSLNDLIEANGKEAGNWFDSITYEKTNKWRMCINLVKAILAGRAIQTSIYFSRRFLEAIKNRIKNGNYDIVIWNHVRLLPILEATKAMQIDGRPIYIVDYHDAISYHYLSAKKQTSIFWKMIFLYEGKRVLDDERRALALCDKAWITSDVDKKFIDSNTKKIKTIPMGVNAALLNYDPKERENAICLFTIIPFHEGVLHSINFPLRQELKI